MVSENRERLLSKHRDHQKAWKTRNHEKAKQAIRHGDRKNIEEVKRKQMLKSYG